MNMNIHIENYRGLDVYFDTNQETFFCHTTDINKYEKRSFAAVKKAIDDYVKNNQEFEPFEVYSINRDGTSRIINIVGIRKDRRFVYENNKGEKHQLSEWDERDYYLINPDNEKHLATMAAISCEIDDLEKKRGNHYDQLILVSVRNIKANYIV